MDQPAGSGGGIAAARQLSSVTYAMWHGSRPLRAGWQSEQIGRAGVSDGSVESAIRRPAVHARPVELVRRIVGGDPHAVDLLHLAMQTPNGGHHAFDTVQSTAPTGNTQAKAAA